MESGDFWRCWCLCCQYLQTKKLNNEPMVMATLTGMGPYPRLEIFGWCCQPSDSGNVTSCRINTALKYHQLHPFSLKLRLATAIWLTDPTGESNHTSSWPAICSSFVIISCCCSPAMVCSFSCFSFVDLCSSTLTSSWNLVDSSIDCDCGISGCSSSSSRMTSFQKIFCFAVRSDFLNFSLKMALNVLWKASSTLKLISIEVMGCFEKSPSSWTTSSSHSFYGCHRNCFWRSLSNFLSQWIMFSLQSSRYSSSQNDLFAEDSHAQSWQFLHFRRWSLSNSESIWSLCMEYELICSVNSGWPFPGRPGFDWYSVLPSFWFLEHLFWVFFLILQDQLEWVYLWILFLRRGRQQWWRWSWWNVILNYIRWIQWHQQCDWSRHLWVLWEFGSCRIPFFESDHHRDYHLCPQAAWTGSGFGPCSASLLSTHYKPRSRWHQFYIPSGLNSSSSTHTVHRQRWSTSLDSYHLQPWCMSFLIQFIRRQGCTHYTLPSLILPDWTLHQICLPAHFVPWTPCQMRMFSSD